MGRSASAAVEKPTKRLRRSSIWELFDALSRFFEVVVILLFLLSHDSGVSASVEIVGEVIRRILCLSSKHLPVFFLGNVIILVVAVLSGIDSGCLRVGDGTKGRSSGVADDIYEEYEARRRVTSVGGGNALEVSLGPEDEKQIVLYSAPGASIDGGNGSRTSSAGTDGKVKNGPPQRRGRLALPGVAGEHASGAPVAAVSDVIVSNGCPQRVSKAEKSIDVASPRGRGRLALPGAVREHALEPPVTKADASSTAGKHVRMKSPSNSSIDRENDSPSISIIVCEDGAKKGPPPRMKEAQKYADMASPHGRGRLLAVRNGEGKSVEHMSNEEFNQSVEKYIAKTRTLLQKESMLEMNFEGLSQSAGYQRIKQRRSF